MRVPVLKQIRQALSVRGRLKPLVGDTWAKPLLLALASVLTGLSEAALLGIIAQVALALSQSTGRVVLSMGPINLAASVTVLIGVAAALALGRLALQVGVVWLPARITSDVQYRLQTDLFAAYAQADWPTQAAEREGHLQELLTSHVLRAARAVLTATDGLAAAFALLALIGAAVAISAGTALFLAVAALGMFLLLRPVGRLVRQFNSQVSVQNLDLAGGISEAVRLSEEARVFGVSESQRRRFRELAHRLREPFFRSQVATRMVPAIYQSMVLLLLVAGLGAMAFLQTPQVATLGTVVLILVRSLSYGQKIQGAYTDLNAQLPFVDRVQMALGRYRGRRAVSGPRSLKQIEKVSLNKVSFLYGEGLPVLAGVSATIRRGEAVGLVGPSGVGKTTLVQILLRLQEPTTGSYLVNSIPAESFRQDDWQRRVAYIPQDPKLLRGTVADNIRFFRDLDDEAVERAAHLAHIHEEIVSRSGGYGAVIDQRGDSVSGGQRQRICLARALAGDPQLLILDEPTSALDAQSENLILQTLHDLKGEVTIVVVAHRDALLEVCDQVWKFGDSDFTITHRQSRPAAREIR